jgi:hypothetical protein
MGLTYGSAHHSTILMRSIASVGVAAAILLSDSAYVLAQAPVPVRLDRPQKSATAVKVPSGAINVDGKLDESAWADVPALTDFVQKDPIEGATPTDQLQIRIAYDDEALYVATRVVSKDPSKIQAPMSRRDNIHQAEHIWISLDTYRDRRTAYSFAVAASGVRGDWYHGSDDEYNINTSYDPVWQAAASIDGAGWTGEMRIPFSQLRFNASDEQEWGINFDYWSPSKNEDVFWIPVPKKEQGWSSWMGTLRGIRGIKPTRRVEVMPYVASNSTVNDSRDRRNPFDDGRNLVGRLGGDLKMGIGPNLTLDATVNPDFGQVEADPAEVNLSAFETFFSERRPFFVEGSQIFQANGASYFYSRRIGARPRGPAQGDFVDYPEASTIYGAAKLTGQLANRTSLGVLAAVTGQEHARGFDLGTNAMLPDTLVAPMTYYGVGRLSRQFGPNQSQAGGIITGVHRDFAAGSPLRRIMNNDAVTGGGDFNLRFKGNRYSLSGSAGFSHVMGDSVQILALQRSSARYFQRPDAESFHVDSSRTSLSGFQGSVDFSKNSGKHWRYTVAAGTESPGFELNDMGRLSTADGMNAFTWVQYREQTPKSFYRNYSISGEIFQERNYDFDAQFHYLRSDANITFKNYWNLALTSWRDFRGLDQRLTRGGPQMGTPFFDVAIISLSGPAAAKTRWNGRVYYGKDDFGAVTNRLSGYLQFKPSTQWDFRIEPNFLRAQTARQYITTRTDGAPETFGRRYVFGFLDQSVFTSVVRLNYAIKPDLTFEMYGEPFAISGRYDRFGELPNARARNLRLYGTDGSTFTTDTDGNVIVTDNKIPTAGTPTQFTIPFQDFNVRSWRSNLVLRWEYRPGSTLYVVWQQNRSAEVANGELVSFGDLVDPFRSRVGNFRYRDPSVFHDMQNFFAIKLNYWLPM